MLDKLPKKFFSSGKLLERRTRFLKNLCWGIGGTTLPSCADLLNLKLTLHPAVKIALVHTGSRNDRLRRGQRSGISSSA